LFEGSGRKIHSKATTNSPLSALELFLKICSICICFE
jgi:hypothetical protein